MVWSLVLHPLVLAILLWAVARDNAETSPVTIFFVAVGMGIGSNLVIMASTPIPRTLSVISALLLALYILMRFCGITLQQSIIVLSLYLVYQVAYSVGMNYLLTPATREQSAKPEHVPTVADADTNKQVTWRS